MSEQKKSNHGARISVVRERAKPFMSAAHLRILTTLPKMESKKPFANRIVYEMTEHTSAPDGQLFLSPEHELNMFWTNLGDSNDEIINLYHAHGECEQYHSEIKTDMGVERLPSGKFDTNELVLELALIAHNILRMLEQETVSQGKAPVKRAVQRRRLRTVIQNIVHFAGHVTKHARQLILSISRSNA